MHELIAWLQAEIKTATNRNWSGKPVIGFNKHVMFALNCLWEKEVQARGKDTVTGWKTDFQKAAKHLLLEYITNQMPVYSSDELPGWQLRMIARWLRGQLPTGWDDDVKAFAAAINVVNRKDAVIEDFYSGSSPTLLEIAWERAQFYLDGREQERTRRAPFPLEKEVA